MNKLKDAVYGFAIGDALGVPFEFNARKAFRCTDMVGYGTWHQPEGTWSDDTSMLLATCDSIRQKGHIDYDDIMSRFIDWLNKANYTAGGKVFDVGHTTYMALSRYAKGAPYNMCGATSFEENGNGSLMRILPLAFIDCTDEEIRQASALTHAHEISLDACVKYVKIAKRLINGETLRQALGIAYQRYKHLKMKDVYSTGYVAHTFDAAMWCLVHSRSYKECVLKAVNLGSDTDTVAAVAGGLAGIIYGYDSIPKKWVELLKNKELINKCVD